MTIKYAFGFDRSTASTAQMNTLKAAFAADCLLITAAVEECGRVGHCEPMERVFAGIPFRGQIIQTEEGSDAAEFAMELMEEQHGLPPGWGEVTV